MNPARQSVPEAGAYRMLQNALIEMRVAERSLTIIEQAAPDPERGRHLAALKVAIEAVDGIVTPRPGS